MSKHLVWKKWGFGVRYYLDPFFGSGQVFWAAPHLYRAALNDKNGFVVNFWRMVQHCTVDKICDAIEGVFFSELEYHAQKRRLFGLSGDLSDQLKDNFDFFDFDIGVLWFWLCKLSFPNLKKSAGFSACRWSARDLRNKLAYMRSRIHNKSTTWLACEDWREFMIHRGYRSTGLKAPRDIGRPDTAILVDPPYSNSISLYDLHDDIAYDVYGFFSDYAARYPDARYCVCGWRADLESYFPGWHIIDSPIGNTRRQGQLEAMAFNKEVA